MNETNMARIWNKHKQSFFDYAEDKNTPLKKKVFVGMSGGVDSSVAAYLLKEQGYDVVGIFINGYNVDGCAERDAEDARLAAEHIGIPFYSLDLREEYFQYVVRYMIEGYKKGQTPNPDVMCNKEIKFGLFLKKARALGADYIATGHYIRLREKHQITNTKSQTNKQTYSEELPIANYRLCIARDLNKDQSYFLWTLTQEQLKRSLFPLGDYTKPEVREIARKAGLPNAEKKDSQGICFLGQVKLPEFLKEYIEPKKGDILDIEGNKVGEHEGVQFYTIGQRHINIIQNSKIKSQKGKADKEPYYVVEKDVKSNVLVVAEGENNPTLFKKEVELTDVHFIVPTNVPNSPIRANWRIDVLVRVRYRQPLVGASLYKLKTIRKPADYKLHFKEPIKFIASGQSAVFYLRADDGEVEMLGGGIIV